MVLIGMEDWEWKLAELLVYWNILRQQRGTASCQESEKVQEWDDYYGSMGSGIALADLLECPNLLPLVDEEEGSAEYLRLR